MNIVKSVASVVALVGLVAAAPAMATRGVDFTLDPVTVTQVAPGQYSFTQGGFSGGASVTGTFAGLDLNSDGQLSYFTAPPDPLLPLEVTDFTMSFSGNSHVPTFSLTFHQLDNFNYLFGPTLGTTSVDEGIESGNFNRFYVAGPGPLVSLGLVTPPGICDGTQACGGVLALPEPSSWALILLGVGGVGGLIRSRRRETLAAI
jgi:hypothetical protein